MHNLAVEKGQFCPFHKKTEKLYPITIGSARAGIARVCRLDADQPHDVDFVQIHMSCTECGLYLGSTEDDSADVLDGMCLQCFRTETEQTDIWYDIPHASKKEDVKLLSDREKLILHFVAMIPDIVELEYMEKDQAKTKKKNDV